MLEALVLFGFLLATTMFGITLSPLSLSILLVVELLSLPGLWLMVRRSAPFVPTARKTLNTMMELAEMKHGKVVYDLGCGDGRIVLEAAKRGAIATGYEFSFPTFLIAFVRTRGTQNAHVRFANFWKQDYRNANVIFCYLLVEPMKRFYSDIWPTLKPGCRVVSHVFKIDSLTPTLKKDGVYLYVK
jgi:SAM-dependent methyltransferase